MGKLARLPAIDMLRGFVIALMALDHARDFFGPTVFSPEDLALTSPGWFWTRWITHLCATTFVLLAGSSAFLRGQGSGVPALSSYLATRGAMLIVLEMTWISFSWQFSFDVFIMQVLWALGAGMVFLSLLVWLPRPAIALIAAALILPHNLFDSVKDIGVVWTAWHQGGFVPFGEGHGITFMYFGGTPYFNSDGVSPLFGDYAPSLAIVYAAWLFILVLMYGLTLAWCRWRTTRLAI